jgi:hypothetical protein
MVTPHPKTIPGKIVKNSDYCYRELHSCSSLERRIEEQFRDPHSLPFVWAAKALPRTFNVYVAKQTYRLQCMTSLLAPFKSLHLASLLLLIKTDEHSHAYWDAKTERIQSL